MPHVSVLLKPASSACNMNCTVSPFVREAPEVLKVDVSTFLNMYYR